MKKPMEIHRNRETDKAGNDASKTETWDALRKATQIKNDHLLLYVAKHRGPDTREKRVQTSLDRMLQSVKKFGWVISSDYEDKLKEPLTRLKTAEDEICWSKAIEGSVATRMRIGDARSVFQSGVGDRDQNKEEHRAALQSFTDTLNERKSHADETAKGLKSRLVSWLGEDIDRGMQQLERQAQSKRGDAELLLPYRKQERDYLRIWEQQSTDLKTFLEERQAFFRNVHETNDGVVSQAAEQ